MFIDYLTLIIINVVAVSSYWHGSCGKVWTRKTRNPGLQLSLASA